MTDAAPGAARLDALERALGHRFVDRALLHDALAHSSRGGGGFDRLEFLGDRVLALVVAELLLERFPDENEGEIARRFARLVSAPVLTELAGAIGLAAHLEVGAGQERALRGNPAVLADAFEAVLGALHRDGGLDAARGFLRRIYAGRLDAAEAPNDPKNALQEWTMARGLGLPNYRTLEQGGPSHAPRFTVEVAAAGGTASATAGSKREAERRAAAALLALIDRP